MSDGLENAKSGHLYESVCECVCAVCVLVKCVLGICVRPSVLSILYP